MTWWMICLLILGALIAIGCIPVGVDAAYNQEGYYVKLKIWLFRVTLLPRPEKPKRAKKQKKKAKQEKKPEASGDQPEKPKKASPLPGGVDGILSLVQLGCDVLGDLRRKLRVDKLYLHVIFGGDAAKAAMNYGRAWALIGALTPMLERIFIIRERDMQPELRYEQSGMAVDARLVMSITIGRSLALALRAGVKFLKLMNKNKKGGAEHEPSSV